MLTHRTPTAASRTIGVFRCGAGKALRKKAARHSGWGHYRLRQRLRLDLRKSILRNKGLRLLMLIVGWALGKSRCGGMKSSWSPSSIAIQVALERLALIEPACSIHARLLPCQARTFCACAAKMMRL